MISSLKLKFDTSTRRALFLSADKLAVYHWEQGKLGSSYLFDASKEGQNYFNRYLEQTPNSTVYFLIDVIEEEYRQDTIPHVYGADRKMLIERKKSRLFRDTPYFHADIQGRQEEGRRDDRVMFMGLTNPEILTPWLNLLNEHKVPLAGIYSLPQLKKELLQYFPDLSEYKLVVSLQSISGLRQTFFHKDNLKMSRLINMPRYGTVSYAEDIRDEIDKIHRYLVGMHLTPEDEPLDVYILANNELLKEVQKLCGNIPLLRFHGIDVNSLARQIGLGRDIITPFSDQLFIYHLLKHRPENLYATRSETRYFQIKNMRQAMLAASMVLILSSVIWGSINFMGGMLHRQQSEAAAKKTEYYNARYSVARKKLPKTAVAPNELQVVVDIVKTLEEYKATPFNMLKLLSHSLDRFPSIQIDKIVWAASADPNLDLDGTSGNDEADQAPLGISSVDAVGGYQYYQIASINGHLNLFDGNYRAALATIDEFTSTFRNTGSVQDASIVSLPLDVSSDASLQGAADSVPGDANFTIRIVLGISHET